MKNNARLLSILIAFLAASALYGCPAGVVSTVTPTIATPTIDPPVARTASLSVTVTGTKGDGTAAWLQLDGEADGVMVAPQDATTTWSYALVLREGLNSFVAFATMETATGDAVMFSNIVGPETIELDTTPPALPVINSAITPTPLATMSLTGTRADDGNLCMRTGQEPTCSEAAPLDGGTSIAVMVSLQPGFNSFCFSSTDDLGNTSAEVCIEIVRVQGPTVAILEPADASLIAGSSLSVVVEVTPAGPTPDDAIASVDVCLDTTTCPAAAYDGGRGAWVGSLDISSLTPGTTHSIDAVGRTVAGVSGTASRHTVTVADTSVAIISNTTTAGHSQNVAMAVDGSGTLHVVWADECFHFGSCPGVTGAGTGPIFDWDIFYRSYSGGAWSGIQVISGGPKDGDSRNPAIAIDAAGNIHIAWADLGTISALELVDDLNPDIVVRVIDGATGAAGTAAVVDHAANSDSFPRLAAAPDGTVHLVWERLQGTDRDIYYSKWTPTTDTWSAASLLISDDANDGSSARPDITTDSGDNAWIVWQDNGDIGGSGTDNDIFLRSVNPAGTAGALVLVSNNGLDGVSMFPRVAARDDVLHILWQDDGNILGSGAVDDIWHRAYFTPTSQEAINCTAVGADSTACLATPQCRWTGSACEVVALSMYLLMSPEATGAGAQQPALALVSDGTIVAAWSERVVGSSFPIESDVYYGVHRGGLTGPQQLAFPTDVKASVAPAIAVTLDGTLLLAWDDDSTIDPAKDSDHPDGGGDKDIYFRLLPGNTGWAQVQ